MTQSMYQPWFNLVGKRKRFMVFNQGQRVSRLIERLLWCVKSELKSHIE